MDWGDKRYYSLNCFLRNKFSCKVYKISLDAGFSCPNRDGKLSTKGCVFCSERGSGDFAGSSSLPIHQQFNKIKEMMSQKWSKGKYIAYFQAYTNTYAPVNILREKYEGNKRGKRGGFSHCYHSFHLGIIIFILQTILLHDSFDLL